MPNWSYLIARLISAVGSWLDASNLRNRVYALEQQNELLRVALDDIARMDPEGRIAGSNWGSVPVTSVSCSRRLSALIRVNNDC